MISITEAKPLDFPRVFELLKQLFLDDKLSKSKTKEIYLGDLKNKSSFELLLKLDNQIIGYAAIKTRTDFQAGGKVGVLSELVIDKKYRGKGYGTKFLNQVIKESKRIDCKEIQFTSTFKRIKAHKFYDSLSFNKTAYLFWKKI